MKIGIDIGGSHIAVGLVDNDKIIDIRERDFVQEERDRICEVIENTMIEYISEILTKNRISIKDIERIGLAVPGKNKDGVMVRAENLGIANFDITGVLKKHFNIENISLNNDAKCAAICEKIYGSLKSYDDAVFMCLGTGIGGAVFLDGNLLMPKRNPGFELRTCNN